MDESSFGNGEQVSHDEHIKTSQGQSGYILLSYLKHPAAVKCAALFPERTDKIFCGRTDGTITVWDLSVKGIVENILPDPDWIHEGEEQSLVGWYGIDKHHSGAIMAIAISPNGKYLATAATDHTTKLWGVTSFMKNVEQIQSELQEASKQSRKLDQCINVFDDVYDAQIRLNEFSGLRIGEVPIPTGYHADIIFTFQHDSTVLCVTFNAASELDAYQISSVFMSPISNEMYAVCQNRVLIFNYHAKDNEDELPDTGVLLPERFFTGDSSTKQTPEQKEVKGDIVDKETLAVQKTSLVFSFISGFAHIQTDMTIGDLKQLISHGLVLPSFLDTLLSQFSNIDSEKLFYNMKKADMSAPPEINNRGGFEDLFKADSPYESDEYRRQVLREQQFYSNRVGEKYEGEQFGPKYQRPTTSGDLLHFIPSEQIKLLKDLQSNREVKPIFLKQVLMDTTRHPNFSPETQIRDTTPWIPGRGPVSRNVSYEIMRRSMKLQVTAKNLRANLINDIHATRQKANRGLRIPRPLHGKGELLTSSSKTIFNPNRYLHTMGLNVKFDAPLGQRTGGSFQTATTGVRAGVGQSEMGIISGTGLITTKPAPVALGKGSLLQGHVRMEPIMITRGGNLLVRELNPHLYTDRLFQDFKQQIISGKGLTIREGKAKFTSVHAHSITRRLEHEAQLGGKNQRTCQETDCAELSVFVANHKFRSLAEISSHLPLLGHWLQLISNNARRAPPVATIVWRSRSSPALAHGPCSRASI
ncbi:hypothetical protein HDU82_007133 [Entophlyctis luteolus]|nr:hypothetical protein HDU82_007133 [Entophlyctis luteolus]